MKVQNLMTTDVVTVAPDTQVSEIAEILHKRHFTGVPVVDGSKKLLGMITERDFIASDSKLYLPTYIKIISDFDFVQNDKKRLSQDILKVIQATAKDIMSTKLITASPFMDIDEAASLFALHRVNPVPVVNGEGVLVGIISRSDLIKLFAFKNIHPILERQQKPINKILGQAVVKMDSSFALVSKTRALYWFIIGVLCFIAGFIMGVIWLVKN